MAEDYVRVPIAALAMGDSPRVTGEDPAHVRLLAGVDAPLPPIVVHRETMRVIDGRHRLLAAALRGEQVVPVRFVDGTAEDAFVVAVQLNRAHGLPLTLADRKAAARRIVESHPRWSNRRIAVVTGLAANTVGAIRDRSTVRNAQSDTRTGLDGRVRPTDATAGRRRAEQVMAADPTASLRQVARAAGISVSTASDVRARLKRGEPAVRSAPPPRADTRVEEQVDTASLLRGLRRDPSLRFTETGRELLRLLEVCAVEPDRWEALVRQVPPHHHDTMVRLARRCAEVWARFGDRLTTRPEPSDAAG